MTIAMMEPSSAHGKRIQMFGVDIDVVNMEEAVSRIVEWATEEELKCRYVVTPNVDHAVMLQENDELRKVYASASLILADGFPIIVASKILKKPLPERVAGSELVPKVFAAATPSAPLSIYLLGAAEGVADRAAEIIHATWPNVAVAGTYSPPMGFEKDEEENERIIEKISEVQPDILVIGLGAPKQELWVHRHFERLPAKVALCVGATIDFLAGEKPQAPVWMRRSGLEWVHRMLSEPKRLVKRYARDAWVFPQIVWKEYRKPSSS
ncbi:WecB/TagA/CpsF family glycosyltransferase [Planctomycetota bacterium]